MIASLRKQEASTRLEHGRNGAAASRGTVAAPGATTPPVALVPAARTAEQIAAESAARAAAGNVPVRSPGTLDGPVTFGKNFDKKIRKHIDQVRNRGDVQDPIPGKGGIERLEQIIRERVSRGGGRETTFAGETAVAFEDGGVTYIFRTNGEFWTILVN